MEIQWEGLPAYVVGSANSKMGLIVIQEWWGLNQNIKDLAKRYSETLPCMAIAPDLYRGRVTQDPDEANHLMGGMDFPGAVQDIKKCSDYLRSKGCTRVGVTGFCLGGSLTLASAINLGPGVIDAGVCFYGIPPGDFADPRKLSIPVQYHFGDSDDAAGFSDKPTADALKSTLAGAGKNVGEFYQYPAPVGHAFMNETSPSYNAGAAKAATERMVSFFKKNLNASKM